jgi:murein DD-endopeptidase MepM/ murein hydrolase activator NlpD
LIRPGGQVGNNIFPSPVSGTVVEVAEIEGYGNTVIVEVDRAGRGYNAGDRVLVAHGSKYLVKKNQKINVGEGLVLSGGAGTTTGRTTAPGVLHVSLLYPGTNNQISPLHQKPQSVQNSFIKSALFPLIRRHDHPGQ